MGRQNIYQTRSAGSVMPPPMIQESLDFFIQNRHAFLSLEKKGEAFKTRFSGSSLLSDIVHRIISAGQDQAYGLIRLPTKTVSLREAVDMTFLPFDVLQMKAMIPSVSTALSLIPELDNKLVINVTDITKMNGDFSDVTQFHYRVVRDFLSRSFYQTGGQVWFNPALVRYAAKVYSMTIGGLISRYFGLSPDLQSLVQTLFCLFFIGRMTSDDVAVPFLKSHGKSMYMPETARLQQILAFVEDTLGHAVPQSLEEVCQVIDALDHSQLKTTSGSRLTRPVLNVRFASLFPDSHVSIIALEYPPYFVFLMVLVLSNVRIGLSFSMKNMNLINEGREVFEQLIKSSMFLDGLSL